MNPSQTSYLLQRVAPIILRELGPRAGSVFAEKVGIPLAKKVGLPLARRIGIPIARKTGMFLFNKVGYPLINKMLLKANITLPNNTAGTIVNSVSAQTTQKAGQTAKAAKAMRKGLNLKNLLKAKKSNKKLVKKRTPQQINNQITQQIPQQLNTQIPFVNPPSLSSNTQSTEQELFSNINNNSSLFNRRRQSYGYDWE